MDYLTITQMYRILCSQRILLYSMGVGPAIVVITHPHPQMNQTEMNHSKFWMIVVLH